MMNDMTVKRCLLAVVLCFALVCLSLASAHAAGLPTLSESGISSSALQKAESQSGIVMEVLGANMVIINEAKHLLCKETQINGSPAEKNRYLLRSGVNVEVVRYHINRKDVKYYISSITIK